MKITYTNPRTGKDEKILNVKTVNLYFDCDTACVHFNNPSQGMIDLAISIIKHIDND